MARGWTASQFRRLDYPESRREARRRKEYEPMDANKPKPVVPTKPSVPDAAKLRAELAALDAKIAASHREIEEALSEKRSLALACYRGSERARTRTVVLEDQVVERRHCLEIDELARADLEREIEVALAAERAELRRKQAAQAEKFAADLTGLGAEVDTLCSGFKEKLLAIKSRLDEARGKGLFLASATQVEASLAQVFKGYFWDTQLRELEITPPDVRHDFAYYTKKWSEAVRGAATRLLTKRDVPTVKTEQVSIAKPSEPPNRWPAVVDIGKALPGDVALGFVVHADKAAADAAHEVAQRGPQGG
jgi:hypothetical protein